MHFYVETRKTLVAKVVGNAKMHISTKNGTMVPNLLFESFINICEIQSKCVKFSNFPKDRDTLNDVMCTCNATSALTSGPLPLDVLLIRLSCDLDLVASYPWKGTPPSTELVARVE
jgi:hypothetical protein